VDFMKKPLASLALLLLATAAQAQQLPSNYMGRTGAVTAEVCVTPIVTAGAYVAGNVVGGLITFPNAFLTANAGELQSVRLTFKSVQTLEFDVTFFSALPATVFTDHAAPAIVAADALLVQPVIKLTNNYSGLGTHTVIGADNLNRSIKQLGSSAYAVVTTTGAPTLASTSDMQLCAAWRQN
jgi:hypothetical protein